jgi:hypothetical protein
VLTSHQGGGLGSAGVVAFEPLYRSAAVPFLSPALTSTKVFDHHPTPGLTVVGSPFELPSNSSRPVSDTPLPLCGFQRSGATCFFGGDPPTPTTSLFVPVVPPPSDDPARGLPFRPAPAVAAARPRWLHQIARLQSFPGVNLPRLTQTAAFITSGYKMDFKAGPPPPGQYRNTGTFRAHKTVCKERLRVYEDLGALRWLGAADTPPGGYPYVQPLHAVVKQGKKARVCVDLSRNVNDYVADEFIKFSSVRSAVQLSQQCPSRLKFYVKLDISACYLSFPLHPDDLPYYVSEVDGAFLQFLSVVFGHKAAPREVSYAMDIVSSALEEAGIAHERYLDDFFIVATSEARAWACAHKAAEIIRDFGLSLAPAKVEGPAPLLEYLGVIVDSVTETLAVSPARRTELLDLLRYFAGRSRASVHQIQSLIGKLSFASQVLPGSRPFLRRLIDLVRGPNGQRRLTSSVRSDLKYWTAHFDSWNGRARWRRDESDPFVFGSDASTTGFGYGLESCPARALASLPPGMQPGTVRMGSWAVSNGDAVRQSTSSTIQYGEAFCVLAAAVEYGSLLRDSHVVFVIDNAADVFVFNRLSTRDIAVGKLLRSLCDTTLQHNFTFSAVHRYGEDNDLFDWASRPLRHKGASEAAAYVAPPTRALALASRHPPLRHPHSLTHVNSLCLTFGTEGSSASWSPRSDGLRLSPCSWTSAKAPAAPLGILRHLQRRPSSPVGGRAVPLHHLLRHAPYYQLHRLLRVRDPAHLEHRGLRAAPARHPLPACQEGPPTHLRDLRRRRPHPCGLGCGSEAHRRCARPISPG